MSVFLPVPLMGMYACTYCGGPARWQALTDDGYVDVCADHLPVADWEDAWLPPHERNQTDWERDVIRPWGI